MHCLRGVDGSLWQEEQQIRANAAFYGRTHLHLNQFIKVDLFGCCEYHTEQICRINNSHFPFFVNSDMNYLNFSSKWVYFIFVQLMLSNILMICYQIYIQFMKYLVEYSHFSIKYENTQTECKLITGRFKLIDFYENWFIPIEKTIHHAIYYIYWIQINNKLHFIWNCFLCAPEFIYEQTKQTIYI